MTTSSAPTGHEELIAGQWTATVEDQVGDPNGSDLPPWHPFDAARPVPHLQSLAPGPDGIRPVDYAAEHQLAFWSSLS